jgi:transcriptional regulator with XRE-family HTH domain
MTKKATLVHRIKAWRIANKLSQRLAAELISSGGVEVDWTTLAQWEEGRRKPSKMAGQVVERYIVAHPRVVAPVERKRSKLTALDLVEMRRLRAQGQTFKEIGQRFKIAESYASRILAGKRLREL